MSQTEMFQYRQPIIKAMFGMPGKIVVDGFSGGGGATLGIERVLGRPVDIAINHDPIAIAMHQANHPDTKHYTQDIRAVDPNEVRPGETIGYAHFSPDCSHTSRAAAGKPRRSDIRDLPWVVIDWAEKRHPELITVENVQEFKSWGPLGPDGFPIKEKAGETFDAWCSRLRGCGYNLDFQSIRASDFGAPTSRTRLFLVARLDRTLPQWPSPTHGDGLRPVHTAAEIIDWSLPCPSIFGRRRSLVTSTLRRIATGVERFVVGTNSPFIVRHGHYSTRTGAGLIPGRGAGTWRGQSLQQPLSTICATNDRHLVTATVERHDLCAAFIAKHYTGVIGHGLRRPLGTITEKDHHSLVCAFLTKYYGTSTAGQSVEEPLDTITSRDRFGLVTVEGIQHRILDIGMRMLQPHELFAAQGFPDDYIINPGIGKGRITKTAQLALCGNSVCPDAQEAVLSVNMHTA